MGVLQRGLTPRCRGTSTDYPSSELVRLDLNNPEARSLSSPLSLSLSFTHRHTHTLPTHSIYSTHSQLPQPPSVSLLPLCFSATSSSPVLLTLQLHPIDTATHIPPYTHTHTHTHTTWVLVLDGGPNGRKSRLMCRTNEEGKKEETGGKNEGKLFTTISVK